MDSQPGRGGRFVLQQPGPAQYRAFIPAPLPPAPLTIGGDLQNLIERASLAVGRVDGITRLLPDPQLFLYMFIRKEAVLSSQIEGTQSSLSDLLRHEMSSSAGVPTGDLAEVSNYIGAMSHGLSLLKRLPLSLRVVREIHERLVAGTRGNDKAPGQFRTTQNWIGGSHPGNAFFVPPPPHEVGPALGNLENFINDVPNRTPTLLKAGISHAQFETIHPFLDGNGRVGRLLITLILVGENALSQPLLYLSLFFKQHRGDYYERLQRIRTHGDWEGWLSFYLEGICQVAQQVTETAHDLVRLFEKDRQAILASPRGVQSMTKVFELLRRKAFLSIPEAARDLELTAPTISAAIKRLEALGIVGETTGRARDRLFRYSRYLEILSAGTQPPEVSREAE